MNVQTQVIQGPSVRTVNDNTLEGEMFTHNVGKTFVVYRKSVNC